MGEDSMNFKRTYEDPLGTPISLAFTSPPVRPSAFTKPTPSSLQSPRNGIEPAAATPPAETQPKYRECLRNHAASHGGHVLDGCGEFMPADAPDMLKCAACGCHRSFHRRETELLRSGRDRFPMLLPPPPPPPRVPSPPPVPVAVGNYSGNGGGATTESSSEGHVAAAAAAARRKRFRTKFTPEQKGRMLEFAERAGWKMQKQDEKAVEQFCAEVGVRRQVLKVWMHNNKHNLRKEQQQAPPPQLQPPPPQLNNSSEIYSGE